MNNDPKVQQAARRAMGKFQTVVLCPRGTDRRVVPVDSVVIPDMWHIAMLFNDAEQLYKKQAKMAEWPNPEMVTITINGSNAGAVRDMILGCWHLANDLLANLKGDTEAR